MVEATVVDQIDPVMLKLEDKKRGCPYETAPLINLKFLFSSESI
jgi:hypothetical protein